jgi:hypothetical protein
MDKGAFNLPPPPLAIKAQAGEDTESEEDTSRSRCMVHEMKVDNRPIILEGTMGLHQPHLPHSAATAPPLTVTVEVEPAVVSCSRAPPSPSHKGCMHVYVRIISS